MSSPARTSDGDRSAAQQAADRIRILREQLAGEELQAVLELTPEQRTRFEEWSSAKLAGLAQHFDVDTTVSQKRASWGMRIASTLGALALCAAVVLFFTRYWGYLSTPAQLGIVIVTPLALLAGVWMRWTRPVPPPLAFSGGRAYFVALAKNAARVDTSGWNERVEVDAHLPALRAAVESGDAVRPLDPPIRVRVLLKQPSTSQEFEFYFSPSGDLLPTPERTSPVEKAVKAARGVRVSRNKDDSDSGSVLEITVGVIAFILTCYFIGYSLKLYRQRSREREIPARRAWLLIIIFSISGGLFVGLSPDDLGISGGSVVSTALAVLAALGVSVFFALGGLFVGAAYASSEGEIREGWPGKLTSFDALLAGRWFTRPVGKSAIVAAACAAWAFFIASLAWRLAPARQAALIDLDLLKVALGPWFVVRSLVHLPIRLSFLIVAGLFMPLAFLHRRRWTGWKSVTLLLVCAFLVDAGFRSFSLSGLGPVVSSLGMLAALVAPFILGDILAAVLGALLYSSLTMAAAIAAAVPGEAGAAAATLGVITLALLPLAAAARYGREVDERTVRPRYAKNLAERLSLKAEVSAARQAQLRLLPQSLPEIQGVTTAAYCQPAGVVGGDFYDFFPAPEGRTAVFVASGGGLGLASALTIALAKGFLAAEVRKGEDPRESLELLVRTLTGRIGAAAGATGFLLMMLDPESAQVAFARHGDYPAVWLLRGKQSSPVLGSHEAWLAGDTLLVHTEGLTALLHDQSPTGRREWFSGLARRSLGKPAGWIEGDLRRRLGGRRGKRLRRLRRDLTTVVVTRIAS